jgi:lipoyl synthase
MSKKFPEWLTKRLPSHEKMAEIESLLSELELNTICQSAHCPNIGECFAKRTAAFMILGNVCTRHCRFCAVLKGKPEEVNSQEPANLAKAVLKLGLKYAVITSVTRDDLEDGGVNQFIKTVEEIKKVSPQTIVELLTPDFKGEERLFSQLVKADFEVFNHNVETVPGLYREVRPEADYQRSLKVLSMVKSLRPDLYTKSGIMVGLGEEKEEVIAVLRDLRNVECDLLTIGQYLQPSKKHLEVKEFVRPEQFDEYKKVAEEMGFKAVASGPFVRSSYQADHLFDTAK